MRWGGDQPTLGDGVVEVRPWRGDDAQWVWGACQDPDIQRWANVPVPYELTDAEAFVGVYAPSKWKNEDGAHFAVVDATTGDLLGCVGLDIVDARSAVAEAGYWTSLAARGTGVTTRALHLLSEWAIESVGVVRLELLIEVENARSRALAERAGFHCEGVMVKRMWRAGAHRDVALYARTN